MSTVFNDVPNWKFDVNEVSANVFKVEGRDTSGRNVEMVGQDPDILLEDCHQYARQQLGLTPVADK